MIKLNGAVIDTIDLNRLNTPFTLVISGKAQAGQARKNQDTPAQDNQTYRITVKAYMTRPSSPEFDFMKVYNHDIPMPLRSMVGTVVKETKGMVYMKLHGDTDGNPVRHCMRCGRIITNPVSQFFGLGVECGQHGYVNPFESDELLHEALENYRLNYLQKIVWEGWIIKSAITSKEVVN